MSSIGEQLKQARETRKLTIKQAVQATRVRSYYLEAMEADDFSALPSSVQARGFLRMYAEFLGLDADDLIARHRAEPAAVATPPDRSEGQTVIDASVPARKVEGVTNPPPVIIRETAPRVKPKPAAVPKFESSVPLTVSESSPLSFSQTILSEIGASLRERRELISLTLDEIERHTHIRVYNLEMIEKGNFDELPSPVQARGMLNVYASFLDMDADAVLLRFADALQARRLERQQVVETVKKEPRRLRLRLSIPAQLRRFISPDLIFGGGMVLLLVGLSLWGAVRLLSGGTQAESTPTQGPSISDVLLASPVATTNQNEIIPTSIAEVGTVAPTLDPALVTETETPPPTVPSLVQITVVVLERTFLRVIVDGKIAADGRAVPGAALHFDANERIEVLTGSGTAVEIIYNQQDLGVMGNFGEVVDRIYTISGVFTPTPTPSATPSITPLPSRTPRPTITIKPTSTRRPTITSTP